VPARDLPRSLRDEVRRIGRADIMVGIPSFRNAASIGHVTRAAQAGLVQYFPDMRPVLVNADGGSPDGTRRVVVETEPPDYVERILLVRPRNRLTRVSLTYPEVDGIGGKGAALRTIFQMARALEVQALVVVDSDLRSIVPEWIELLAGPIQKGGFDFVAPLYVRDRWDGTITNTVTYPMTRALYGLRIRQPIGGDFGVSGDLVGHYLEQDDWTADVSRFGIDIWMTTTAIAGGFAVCQARLGSKVHDPKDPGADLGPMFSQVLATLLRLIGRHAGSWLPVRGSHAVPDYGFERVADPPRLSVDVARLLEAFVQGSQADGETWRAMLASRQASALERLAERASVAMRQATGTHAPRSPGDLAFAFPDETWARVVYDVAFTARFGSLPLERLVAALVPLYFGRVASLVLETREMTNDQAEALVERQARAYELAKPGFAERWQAAAGQVAAGRSGRAAAARDRKRV
jgi:hypothetical protein